MLRKEEEIFREICSVSDEISEVIANNENVDNHGVLTSWMAKDQKNGRRFAHICSEGKMREELRNYQNSGAEKAFADFVKKREKRSARRILFRGLSGAAVVALGFGIWGVAEWQGKASGVSQELLGLNAGGQEGDSIGGNRPRLTLTDGTRMSVWGEGIRFEETAGGQQVLLGDSLLSHKEDSNVMDKYNLLEVPAQCDFRFTLSDGTRVWMNAASSLKYPAKFASNSRTVYASGEVYLEVAKDAGRPFYVVVDGMSIRVLGTAFNVRAYPNEGDTRITLVEGEVAAQIREREYTLTPGRQLKMDNTFGGVGIREVDTQDITAWTRGYYVFKKSRLQEVANTLQNWYGITIMMTSDISAGTTYTGVVNKNEPLDIFLQRLEQVSNVKCNRHGDIVTIY